MTGNWGPEYTAVLSFQLHIGVDCNILDNEGDTALLDCVKTGGLTYDILEMLHRAGADMSAANQSGETVWPVLTGRDSSVVSVLVTHGVDTNLCDNDGNTPLLAVARNGELTQSIIDILYTSGADMSAINKAGETVLHVQRGRDSSVVSALMNPGLDINASNTYAHIHIFTSNDCLTQE
jgi:ankyrin repeat protein